MKNPEKRDLFNKNQSKQDKITSSLHHLPEKSPKHSESTSLKKESEQNEISREILEKGLSEILFSHAKKINEGNNGVIFSIKTDDIPNNFRELFQKKESLEDELAAKVLKIYHPGYGEKEYKNQHRAYDILHQSNEKLIAQVPEPHFLYDVTLSEKLRDKINNTAENFHPHDHAEVMLMDFVHGEDIWTSLAKEVLRHHPKSVHLVNDIDTIPLSQLEEEVANALHFVKPGGKARSEGERIHEQIKILSENKQKVFDFLEKSGVQIHPDAVTQIHNALNELHKNGMTILDAHHRNFMVVGNLFIKSHEDEKEVQEEPPKIFMIDFENVAYFTPGLDEQEIFNSFIRPEESDEIKYRDPRSVERDLAKLTSSKEERAEELRLGRAKEYQKNLIALRKRITQSLERTPNSPFAKAEKKLALLLENSTDIIDVNHAYSTYNNFGFGNLDYVIVALERLEDQGTITKKVIQNFLHTVKEKLPQNEQNSIMEYLKLP